MLFSLFGELGPRRWPSAAHAPAGTDELALRIENTEVMVESDAAQAMRANFEATRSNLGESSSMITLVDPSGLCAPHVLRALSEAGGHRMERIHLRERGTLRSVATIERTTVSRIQAQPLKVYYADIRPNDGSTDDLLNALAERSHLTAVIVGSMAPHAVTGLIRSLLSATRQPEWQCPWLVFILPPGASGLRHRILEQDWPSSVRTAAMSEALSGPASVWNAVLTAWEAAAQSTRSLGHTEARIGPPQFEGEADPPNPPQWLAHLLESVARTEGVLACGIAELDRGELIAMDAHDAPTDTLQRIATSLCAARRAHLAAGGPDAVAPDELLVSMGARQALLRPLAKSSSLGFVAMIDRSRSNLALLRYRLMGAERQSS
jgi:hypothetical protein